MVCRQSITKLRLKQDYSLIIPRLIRHTLLVVVFALPLLSSAQEKDLFDQKSSEEYAKFLLASGQFELASFEYRRLSMLDVDNSGYFEKALESLYRGSLLDQIKPLVGSRVALCEATDGIARFLLASEIKRSNLSSVDSILACNSNIIADRKIHYSVMSRAFAKDWEGAISLANEKPNSLVQQYLPTLEGARDMKRASPFLAGTMSAIIPGTGKMYARDWKNGIISLAFIGIFSYQAYLGFSRRGVNSGLGWVYSVLGFGFYTGNIAGSVRSAKRFNRNQEKEQLDRLQPYLLQ